ncbi:glycosyltransferase family 39 protein [Methylomonas montana]|uniref:ArnT family glycosyltransferase n=1 Tax=Methylomonas montana TaxID=3058963 RepID=UPI0026599A0E|nr:glycosyltransferase family 39 protein [Methylomonas montana]WKJ88808.1 glycosyltransferase family 39 protein [Methylomonas montana]
MSEKLLGWIADHSLALLLAILFVRGGFLLINGFDLIGDESYYWDWSRQPDWCYYSKPPMVAWLIGAFTWLLGDHTFTVRLPALLLGTVFLWFFHATARAFYGARGGAMALLLVLATPINVLANFLMTIDPPLYCFWMMSIYYLRRALFDADQRAWLWAGLASAAALLSKQSALILPLMLLVFLLQDSQRRHLLKTQFWLYLLPIVVAAVPIVWWNLQHDWVMFGHSKSHFGNHEPVDLAKHLQWARDFLLYQILLVSPVIFVLVVTSGLRAAFNFKRLSAEQRFLLLMGPALLLGVLLLSFLQKAQGNWPMPFYFSGLILLAGNWLAGAWKKSLKFGLLLGYTMVAMTYVLPIVIQALNLQHTAFDPTKRFKSWQELAVNIHFERLISLPDPENTFVVALGHRYLASQLAFYLPDHPKVYRFEQSGQVGSQYEVWPGPLEFVGKNGFVIGQSSEESLPTELKAAFQNFRFLAQIPNPSNPNAPYYLYLGENLKFWPEPTRQTLDKDAYAPSEN